MTYSKQLYHYGVKGQTWGVRKYQYEDGTYTPAGKERYFGNNSKSSTTNSSGGKNTAPSSNQRTTTTTPTTNRTTGINSGTKTHGVNYSYYNSDATSRLYNSKIKFNETPDKNSNNKKVVKNNLVGAGKSGKSGSGKSKKSKKSEEEKAAEKAAKEAEKERKKAEREAEKERKKAEREAEREAKKKASAASKAAKDKEKEEKQKAKVEAEAKAKAEAEAKAKEAEKKKPVDPIDEDETLSEREKRMYKGIRNILEKTGQSMETYYKNEGFDAIFNRYFPGDLDEDEKKVIKKKFMNYYKLEHGESAIGEYYAVTYSSSLSHHGILGMKWGIRRYQNEDGTLTEAGKKRYGSIERFNKEMHNREVRKKNFKKAGRQLAKNIKSGNTYRYILAENYKTNYGMDSKSAKAAAKRRADFAKKVAIGAGVAIGVGAAVAGGIYLKRRHDTLTREVLDSVLKSGTKIQTLSLFPDRLTSGKAFYESHREEDMARYIRDFGKGSRNLFEAPEYKYKLNATVDKDIKVAGIKTGSETFKSLMNNNSEFKDLFETSVAPGHVRHVGAAASDYNKFNTLALLMPGEKYERMRTIFFDELKSKGYGAVADINDRKNNSFKTHANIVFDYDSFVKNNQGIMNVEIRKLNSLDRLQAEKILEKKVQRETWEEILSTPMTSASFATTAACVALGTFDAKEGINYHLEKSKRSKEKK